MMRIITIIFLLFFPISTAQCITESSAAYQVKETDREIDTLTMEIVLSPDNNNARYSRSLLYEGSGQYSSAVDDLLILFDAGFMLQETSTRLSILYFYLGETEKSDYYF
ncbi:MAG: hypothetical protein ACOCWH_01880, partial [Spirochaetota bacterium]